MREIQLLKCAKQKLNDIESNHTAHNKSVQNLENSIHAVFDAILDEAFQTPAGIRWFNGQLKIYQTAGLFYRQLYRNMLNNPNALINITEYQRCLDELDKIIQSGIRRYITG